MDLANQNYEIVKSNIKNPVDGKYSFNGDEIEIRKGDFYNGKELSPLLNPLFMRDIDSPKETDVVSRIKYHLEISAAAKRKMA